MRVRAGLVRHVGIVAVAVLAWAGSGVVATATAHAPSGAIFTTLPNGSEVNFNHFPTKQDVYLDGGPGPGAPATAAGLDDGTYVFQVTDPSGKALLSTDPARCRQFIVTGGIITSVVATGCQHVVGTDVDHGATTVQLYPYLDTPNNGGVYKAWATRVEDYLLGCSEFGVADGLASVDCGNTGGNRHGFIPSHSKTDNFKVGDNAIVEIDTQFTRESDGALLLGQSVLWRDPVGGSNTKWSYNDPSRMIFSEAHVEAVEVGTHTITLSDQPGCTVHEVRLDGRLLPTTGPQTVAVTVKQISRSRNYLLSVDCH